MDMNTIGKTLVILNFVFALIVGGFLVIDYARRSNWKSAYDSLEAEMKVLKSGRDASYEALAKEVNRSTPIVTENTKLRQDVVDREKLAEAEEAKLNQMIADLKTKAKGNEETLRLALADQERLKTELVDRNKTISDREQALVKMEADRNKYHQNAISLEGRAKALQERNEALMEELVNKTKELARVVARGPGGTEAGASLIRSTGEPNLPPVKVKGRIERVDATEPSLVQISLGSDQGINRNNTLYAYRSNPKVEYLGQIRIVDVYPTRAVGRLEIPPGGVRHALKEGDSVSSYLGQ
jgi:hypothetical protein